MIFPSILALVASALSPTAGRPAAEPIEVFAALAAEELEVGGSYEFLLEVVMDEALKASGSGAPAPFVQLDVPPSVRLVGPYLETYQELAKNEFLQAPYERLLEENPLSIPFELVAEPGPDERLGINVLAYVRAGEGEEFFFRRRIEVPIAALSEGHPVPATDSSWGADETLLQIGAKAVDFELPRADGTLVKLSEHLGKKNVIVTTYRAFW